VNGAVAIFVKTPGHSPVKTRLAAGIGAGAAGQWYRQAAAAVAEVLSGVPGLTVYWAVAESLPGAKVAWPGLPHIEQGDGKLGRRMGRVHAELLYRHDFALLLGADTPQLDPADVAAAASWLAGGEPRLVMGPARDGGFWLIGANSPAAPAPADWLRQPCGRADTASGFLEAMRHLGAWRMLPTLTDVDRAEDLEPMLGELARLPCPAPAQLALAALTRSLLAATWEEGR
jgi:uncharacterized protein